MLYRDGFKSANLLKVSLVMAAAMLAICLLALVETKKTAQAEDSLPENGKIAFQRRSTTSAIAHIYTVDPDGSNLSNLTNDSKENDMGELPAWSPDGTKIAYVSYGPRITVMDADGSNKKKLSMRSRGPRFTSPTWSADGTQLAFSTSTPMQSITPDIYTSDTDGSDLTNLTNSPEIEEFDPDYSPDGSHMCFTRGDFKTGWGIYIAKSDGSNPTRLVGDEPPENLYSYCDWSPDGTKIVYSYHPESRGAEYYDDVYVMNADGSGKINLTRNSKEADGSPSWSPDGTKIVFSSFRDGNGGIYTMDADGSDVARVTKVTKNSGYGDGVPDWQPLTPESRSMTVDQPDTGGPSLILVATALLFSGGVMFYAGLKHRV